MDNKLIDLAYLNDISMGNKNFELKLMATFVEQTQIEIEKITDYFQRGDWDALCASVHKIKPSFHFIGALETEALLNTIEDIARNKSETEKLPGLMNEFFPMCKKILEEIRIEIAKYESRSK